MKFKLNSDKQAAEVIKYIKELGSIFKTFRPSITELGGSLCEIEFDDYNGSPTLMSFCTVWIDPRTEEIFLNRADQVSGILLGHVADIYNAAGYRKPDDFSSRLYKYKETGKISYLANDLQVGSSWGSGESLIEFFCREDAEVDESLTSADERLLSILKRIVFLVARSKKPNGDMLSFVSKSDEVKWRNTILSASFQIKSDLLSMLENESCITEKDLYLASVPIYRANCPSQSEMDTASKAMNLEDVISYEMRKRDELGLGIRPTISVGDLPGYSELSSREKSAALSTYDKHKDYVNSMYTDNVARSDIDIKGWNDNHAMSREGIATDSLRVYAVGLKRLIKTIRGGYKC